MLFFYLNINWGPQFLSLACLHCIVASMFFNLLL
uniref:Uncharacterized protein n=1 Tax=Manihot esculenta TaxID=3983 RepID=A0A2C9WA75_MANES